MGHGIEPILLTVHSYTPSIAAPEHQRRISFPDVGLLFYKECKILNQFDEACCQSPWSAARNVTYDLKILKTGSLMMHQKEFELDALALEINVDNLRTFADQSVWADFLGRII